MAWVLGASVPAGGAEWSLIPALTGRVEYNDNLALRFEPAPSWRYLLQPGATLSRRTESGLTSVRARLGFNRYSNATIPDATDRALTLTANQNLERHRLGALVDYSEVSSQSAQVLGQTGLNIGRRQVETLSVSPNWTYSMSPRLSLNASAAYVATRFEQSGQATVTDFRNTTVSLGLTRTVTERSSVGLSLGYLQFDTSPFTSESNGGSINASLTHALAPNVKATLTAGIQRVMTRQNQVVFICPVDPTLCSLGLVAPIPSGAAGETVQTLYPFSANLEWQPSERESVAILVQQRVNPTGAGVLTTGFQASATYTRALSPTADLSVAASYFRTRSLGGTAIGDIWSLAPGITWRRSEAWTFSAGYGYTLLTYPDIDRDVESNAVFVSASYGWPARTW